ncbi:MAG: hypothetical protein NVSMB2_03580 [Chloroflexota bacterium]
MVAEARSAPRPTRTADRLSTPGGTFALAAGEIVRTMGGAATVEGDALETAGEADGDGTGVPEVADSPGDELGKACMVSDSLALSVGGTPGGVGAMPRPGTAPLTGRSIAGPHAATKHSRLIQTGARHICRSQRPVIGVSLRSSHPKP